MEFKFTVEFATELSRRNPDDQNALRYIEEFGLEQYMKNLQGYVLVVMEQEMSELFANQLKNFSAKVEAEGITVFNKNRDDIMRSAF